MVNQIVFFVNLVISTSPKPETCLGSSKNQAELSSFGYEMGWVPQLTTLTIYIVASGHSRYLTLSHPPHPSTHPPEPPQPTPSVSTPMSRRRIIYPDLWLHITRYIQISYQTGYISSKISWHNHRYPRTYPYEFGMKPYETLHNPSKIPWYIRIFYIYIYIYIYMYY